MALEQEIEHSNNPHWLSVIPPNMIRWNYQLDFVNFYEAIPPDNLLRGYYRPPKQHHFLVAETNEGELEPLFLKYFNKKDLPSLVHAISVLHSIPVRDTRINFPEVYGVMDASAIPWVHFDNFQILEFIPDMVPVTTVEITNSFQYRAIANGILDAVNCLLEYGLIMQDVPMLFNFGVVEQANAYFVYDLDTLVGIDVSDEARAIVKAYTIRSLIRLNVKYGSDPLSVVNSKRQILEEILTYSEDMDEKDKARIWSYVNGDANELESLFLRLK